MLDHKGLYTLQTTTFSGCVTHIYDPDVSKKEKEEKEILGLSSFHKKESAGRISRFDPGVEAG